MAPRSVEPRSDLLGLLAVAAVACELLPFAWAGGAPDGLRLGIDVALRLLGIAFGLVAGWLLCRRLRVVKRELAAARQSVLRAAENERAMQQAQNESEEANALLAAALDALPIGIAIFDPRDRLVIRNACLGYMMPDLFEDDRRQHSFESLLRREIQLGLWPDAAGREDEWLARRLQDRGTGNQPLLQRQVDERWIHIYEVRTPLGYWVIARAEVTELVRKEKQLAQANAALSHQTATDGLTGIANRRRFDETLAVEWARAARAHASLALLIVDIDHFKRFNDHYGHVAGDECLRRVAKVLTACVRRAGELVARYGGEEFVLLLPGADLAQAEDMARRCQQGMRREAIPHGSSPTAPHITFSMGIAHVIPSMSHDPESLVNAADAAMYRAKMAGRAGFATAGTADWEIDKDAPRSTIGGLL